MGRLRWPTDYVYNLYTSFRASHDLAGVAGRPSAAHRTENTRFVETPAVVGQEDSLAEYLLWRVNKANYTIIECFKLNIC